MITMKPGDVIIFEAGDSWLSKCIAKLTNSTVSHAAIRYSGDNMIEMGGNGIQLSSCRETAHGGEKAYLLRLSPEKDPAAMSLGRMPDYGKFGSNRGWRPGNPCDMITTARYRFPVGPEAGSIFSVIRRDICGGEQGKGSNGGSFAGRPSAVGKWG